MKPNASSGRVPGIVFFLATVAACSLPAGAATVTLQNADFETGPWGPSQVITGWDEYEAPDGGNDDNYNESRAGAINSNVLHLKGDGGNWVGQDLTTADTGAIDATSFGSYTVQFDYGYRADVSSNWGHGDITVRIALWNTTTGTEVAGYDLVIPDPNQQQSPQWTETGRQVTLEYDNTAQNPGDVLQLRFTHVSPDLDSSSWQATAMFDNIGVTAAPLDDLLVSPGDSLQSTGNPGGHFSPSSITYTLTNNGSQPADWNAAHNESWVSLSQSSGTLAPGASTDLVVSINSNADTLPIDSYSDTVTISNLTTGVNRTRSVSLSITLPPGDADGDGLPNQWEYDNGLDPYDDGSVNPDNGAWGDPDADGLPNDEEYFMNSDPRVNESGKPWQPRPEKARLMVVNAHPDDEGIFFGGTFPYYTQVRHLPTVSVSMTSGDWNRAPEVREAEFRNAVWAYGLRVQPIFPRFRDYPTDTLDETWDVWADGVLDGDGSDVEAGKLKATRTLAKWIRRYRPDVVVTHDLDGEYGHNNHKATSRATIWAVDMAADASVDIEGLPAWQVKKLYLHNYDPGSPNGTAPLFHDFWQTVSIDSDGDGIPDQTPIDTANVGLDFHVSQSQPNVSTCYASGETNSSWEPYPCEWWGLYFSTVGPDTIQPDFTGPDANNNPVTYSGWAKGDFFEHLAAFPDSDADQLDDAWELDHFASLAAAVPTHDDDHDGLDNQFEFTAGLDPQSPDRIDVSISAHSVDFTVPGTAGVNGYDGLTRRYRLLYSPDMVDWSTVVAEGVADGTPLTYPIPEGQTRGFYRLELTLE